MNESDDARRSAERASRDGASVHETQSTLDIAARSLLASQAISGTVAGLVAERTLDRAFEGLFQYAFVRVGRERATEHVTRLARAIESSERAALERSKSPLAHLYSSLRASLEGEPRSPLAADARAWWPVAEPELERYEALRASLDGDDAEIVELRFARRLSVDEVALVVGREVDEVRRALSRGLAASREVFGRRAPSQDGTHEGVLLEAFALDPAQVIAPLRSVREPVLEVGTVVAGRYEIGGLLGVGAFADVYRASDCEVRGHVVALKILRRPAGDARSVRAALRELQLLASVFHPSVVQLKDHGWHQGHLWFVMPLYKGETLATRLRRGPLSRDEARSIFEQLAEALATMHRAGVRHQDVKPENVFLARLELDEEGDASANDRVLPILLDLGVAAKDAELVLAGTPAYFAPEVAARFAGVPDPSPVGPKADVFSLALTLRQALEPKLAEHLPGGAVDAFVSYRALHAPEPPSGRELSDLKPSFARWLSTSPDKRPTAEELRKELAVLTRPAERMARRVALLRWFVPLAASALAVFLAVVSALSRQAEISRDEAMRASERADRARERAASISQSLSEQEARRAELEADVARLEQQYQTSRLTREQLASRLARTEGELAVMGDRERAQASRVRQQLESIGALEQERARLVATLASTEARVSELGESLTRERARGTEAEANVARTTEQLRASEANLAEARAQLTRLERRIAVMEEHERRSQAPLVLSPTVPSAL